LLYFFFAALGKKKKFNDVYRARSMVLSIKRKKIRNNNIRCVAKEKSMNKKKEVKPFVVVV
jgi:hypothetical protein